jgi:DNA-binding MarR family transcriptional regulator
MTVEPRRLDDLELRAWRTLIETHDRLVARLDAELQASQGMSLPEYQVLVQLSEVPGQSLRMAELAERLHLSPSGVTRRLDGLVKQGQVERQACPEDRRGSLAVLTPLGLARLVAAAPTHVAGVRRYVIDPLDRPQLVVLADALSAVSEALSEP